MNRHRSVKTIFSLSSGIRNRFATGFAMLRDLLHAAAQPLDLLSGGAAEAVRGGVDLARQVAGAQHLDRTAPRPERVEAFGPLAGVLPVRAPGAEAGPLGVAVRPGGGLEVREISHCPAPP